MSPSAAAIRIADHLRPILFQHVFRDGRSVKEACDLILSDQRVKIPYDVAGALVREETARRTVAEEARHTRRIVDAIAEVPEVEKATLDLPPGRGHKARVEFSKGNALVACSCGARVCRVPRTETGAIERAWFEHRDGEASWKKAS
jgi:hypothetical protein